MVVMGFAGRGPHRNLAGAHRCAAEMDRAGTAVAGAAPVLRTGETESVTQDPEERSVGRDVYPAAGAVDLQNDGRHGGPGP